MKRGVASIAVVVSIGLLAFDLLLIDHLGILVVIPIAVLPFALVGALIIDRIPRNPVGWLLAGSGLLFELSTAGDAYAWAALVRDRGRFPGGELAAAFASASFTPALVFAVMVLLFFPSGSGLGGRWTWIERATLVLAANVTLVEFLKDAPVTVAGTDLAFPSPLAVRGPLAGVVTFLAPIFAATMPVILVGPISLFVRYRRSSRVERDKIKWLAYTGTLALVILVAANLTAGDLSKWLFVGGTVLLGTVPISIGVAILRYRLYDIDVLINRTLVYGALTALLGLTYVLGIVLLQALLRPLTSGSEIAVTASTLGVTLLFGPLRRRIQRGVDRRFYRRRYDASATVDAFALRLRDSVDLDALTGELLAVVGDTVQPAHASVWLRERVR